MGWIKNWSHRSVPSPSDGTHSQSATSENKVAAMNSGPPTLGGTHDLAVVGESFYQEALREICGTPNRSPTRAVALLRPEVDNKYDANAIAVTIDGRKVGHLSRTDASALRPGLDRLVREQRSVALQARIVGGGVRPDGSTGLYGVWLAYNPVDFGVAALESTKQPQERTRTGVSTAVDTDLADESYDLGWMNQLSDDRTQRVTEIRKLIDHEREPISRHFLFTTIESDLYALRNASADILAQYDVIAEQHHDEMDVIRPALIAKFGGLPLLETYKQSTIRHTKASDFSLAITWARRGIDVYGNQSLNPAWPDDLRKRFDRLSNRLEREDPVSKKEVRRSDS